MATQTAAGRLMESWWPVDLVTPEAVEPGGMSQGLSTMGERIPQWCHGRPPLDTLSLWLV